MPRVPHSLSALAAALALLLLSMTLIPFYDTSEPRYAEIARIMAQSGDWITPWFNTGVPFWGKPPLSFWTQALSMNLFGSSELAARLPSWLCLLLSNAIILIGLRAVRGPRVAMLTAIIYSTSALVYISSGAVLTDPFLALGTNLSLISFAVATRTATTPVDTGDQAGCSAALCERRTRLWWRYGLFLGLAMGLLSKGPLAAVLIFAPIGVWYAFNWRRVVPSTALPWGKGLLLATALSLPWYILAELKTPGFADYFIIGEHIRRFLDPGWAGDLYGSAHQRPYGTIWLYWLAATFPWGLLTLAAAIGAWRSARLRAALRATAGDPLFSYWLAAAMFTPVFFTFAANILWTYLLPSLAGFSILAALLADQIAKRFGGSLRTTLTAAAVVPLAVLAFGLVMWVYPDLRNTERSLVRYVKAQAEPGTPLRYIAKPPFSARYYSAGQVEELKAGDLGHALACDASLYVAMPKDEQAAVAQILKRPLDALYANKRYVLIKVSGAEGCRRPAGTTSGDHIAANTTAANTAAASQAAN